ncbi:MAG: LPP20 family lipoprotein [Marinifilaceae bacterium]|jgi:hypothetical protein|nr:LPP20 family lipoprotein [Marinifilaceae bacterium]
MKNIYKASILFLLIFLYSINLNAQSIREIKSNDKYLWGIGYGKTESLARDEALSNLVAKVSINIEREIKHQFEEDSKKRNSKAISDKYNCIVKSYSAMRLNNAKFITISKGKNSEVFCFVSRYEIKKVFKVREDKIADMLKLANKAQKRFKIDDALRYYYWAWTLLKTLPNCNHLSIPSISGEYSLVTWIPDQIENIFDDVQVSFVSKDGNEVLLSFMYLGKMISSIDYSFFNGASWSNLYSAKDGNGVMELRSSYIDRYYRIKFEYEYKSQAYLDPEISKILPHMQSANFKSAYKKIRRRLENKKDDKNDHYLASKEDIVTNNKASFYSQKTNKSSMKTANDENLKLSAVSNKNRYKKIMHELVKALRTQTYKDVRNCFTLDGYKMYKKLLNYGRASIVGDVNLRYISLNDKVMCRGLFLKFSFKGNKRTFVEDVVFTFNKNNKIDCVAFGIGKRAEKDILSKSVWPKTARFVLIQFLENYKTAYALKRLDYIKSIFDDNAVIIVGKIVRRSFSRDMNAYSGNKFVKLTKKTKYQYLRDLKKNFSRNDFINIRFSKNEVVKMGRKPMYGIQIKQDYYSNTYGDSGYLCLIVDLTDNEKPLIKVRTWQEEKDPKYGIFSPYHF